MVSTRQMTITTAPGAIEESFDTTASTSNMPRTVTGTRQINSIGEIPKQSILLLDLPIEILDKIFSYVGYKNVAHLRIVSSKMNQICSSILNSTFQKLQTQTYNHFQTVKKTMPKRESARRIHPSASECDIVETCYMRLSLLEMTFGKHIDKKHCCFFPGGILDEVYYIFHYIKTTPKLGRPYKITEELFDLSTMAMEYFKEKLEPNLPAIAYFSKDFLDFSCTKNVLTSTRKSSNHSSSMPSPPQSNMVLRKGIRKIKQGMKKYNNQLTVLRNDLRFCKRKSTEQTKQISEMQKLLSEQQKQILEYAARLDENDKKNEEMSMKISTLLQEANKCKTELQYWRSKSPAITNLNGTNLTQDMSLFLQQCVNGPINELILKCESDKNEVQSNVISIDLTTSFENEPTSLDLNNTNENNDNICNNQDSSNVQQIQKSTDNLPNETTLITDNTLQQATVAPGITQIIQTVAASAITTIAPTITPSSTITQCNSVGSPKLGSKRKHMDADVSTSNSSIVTITKALSIGGAAATNDIKKPRKVQNKARYISGNVTSSKTRSK